MITVILQVSNYKESFQDRNFQLIQGIPVISYIVRRIKRVPDFDLIIATSDRMEDSIFEEVAKAEGVKIYRGAFDNVLSRLCGAANENGVNDFVRIFATYPLLDLEHLKSLFAEHIQGSYDYSYNEHLQGVIWGTGCEVFHVPFINQLNELELQESQRETISFFIRQNNHNYKILKKKICDRRPGYKVCLETKKDLRVIQELSERLETLNNEHLQEYLSKHKVLSMYNLEEPAKEVGMEKLFLHPRKVQELISEEVVDLLYPISVEMTLTNICNLKCVYCSDKDLCVRQGRDQEIPLDVIKRLFSDLSGGGTKGVVLEGGGEPILYSHFAEVVNCAKENDLAIGLITNGTVKLDSALLKEFEWIRVSLDASNASEYMELKGVDCFERVVTNIAHYAKYCKTVGIGYVVTNRNISQLESLVMRLRVLGASYIQLRPVVDCEELYPHDINLSYLKFYQSHSFGVIVDGMTENAASGNHRLPCRAHSVTSIISGDGSVYLCGRLNVHNWLKPIGNINQQSFKEIWLGTERREQIAMVNDAEFCLQNCPQCRISKFNELLERLSKVNSRHFI